MEGSAAGLGEGEKPEDGPQVSDTGDILAVRVRHGQEMGGHRWRRSLRLPPGGAGASKTGWLACYLVDRMQTCQKKTNPNSAASLSVIMCETDCVQC